MHVHAEYQFASTNKSSNSSTNSPTHTFTHTFTHTPANTFTNTFANKSTYTFTKQAANTSTNPTSQQEPGKYICSHATDVAFQQQCSWDAQMRWNAEFASMQYSIHVQFVNLEIK
jgi:hypothetical protein